MENEKSNQSIVNFSFVVTAFVAYLVVAVLFETFADTFGPVAHLRAIELAKHGIPVGTGLITFLVLFMNKKTHLFVDEVVTEVGKVVWPSQKDTVTMTIVCCVMCLISGLSLGIFDFISSQLIKIFVG
jgi:preprotein translocase subunit SecE